MKRLGVKQVVWVSLFSGAMFSGTTVSCVASWAQDPTAASQPAPATPAPASKAAARTVAKTKKPKSGKVNREKDAEGTEAPNRFQADTVIKSQYKLHGQQLEVDPD